MKEKKGLALTTIVIISLIIGIILVTIGIIIYTNSYEETNDNKKNHRDEFNIVESNYLERYYKRYISYKKSHKDYSDDQIITYVNIGLDQDYYSNVQNTNESDGILKIVNKYYVLSKDYVPKLKTVYDCEMDETMAKAYDEMYKAGVKGKVELEPAYAYLEYDLIKSVYDYEYEKNKSVVDLHYGRAGHSEYQTGLAVCIGFASEEFQYTKESDWLENHAYEYGFILRYPKGKEHITGFEYEPWHYRYVGKEVAKIIHDKGLTFEEYYATYVLK